MGELPPPDRAVPYRRVVKRNPHARPQKRDGFFPPLTPLRDGAPLPRAPSVGGATDPALKYEANTVMASLFYLLGCGMLSALAVLELKSRNRTERIQLYVTLLGALVFCGIFALLVSAAQAAGGRYQTEATGGIVLLTAGSLLALTRASGRFQALQLHTGTAGKANI